MAALCRSAKLRFVAEREFQSKLLQQSSFKESQKGSCRMRRPELIRWHCQGVMHMLKGIHAVRIMLALPALVWE